MTMNLHSTQDSDFVDVNVALNNNWDRIDFDISQLRYADMLNGSPPFAQDLLPGTVAFNASTSQTWWWDGTSWNQTQYDEVWGPWTTFSLNAPFVSSTDRPCQYRVSKKSSPFVAVPPFASLELAGIFWNTAAQNPIPTGDNIIANLPFENTNIGRVRAFNLGFVDTNSWFYAQSYLIWGTSLELHVIGQGASSGAMPRYVALDGMVCGSLDGY